MKNQYFGDKRDLLKFTLLESLAHVDSLEQLTCIWMLTPPSANNDGNKHFKGSTDSSELARFLQRCLAEGRRDVREFAAYMATRREPYFSFGDDAANYFTTQSRSTYFDPIPELALQKAVVFFDPDNGLEPGTTVSAAHLRYAELQRVFERMDELSIAVVYQHLPRQRRNVFWPGTAERVRAALGARAGFVAATDIGFVLALKDGADIAQIGDALEAFRAAWADPLLLTIPY